MFCPQCKSEYRAGFTRCAECGVVLLHRLPSEPPRDAEDEMELVVIRTYDTRIDVDLAQSALEAAGIESITRPPGSGGRPAVSPVIGGVDLIVRSEDASDANQILDLDVTS
jgi:hypothetical protein